MTEYKSGSRVEWNPTGDEWKPATVHRVGRVGVLIRLDENGQTLLAQPEHLRSLDDVGDPVEWLTTAGSPKPQCETVASVRCEPPSLSDAVRDVQGMMARHREQLARDLAGTPDPALKMRVAELLAIREQCRTGESDCDAWRELADLRWVLARRAESAESIPQGDGTDKGGR
jgi:hypothetical protein